LPNPPISHGSPPLPLRGTSFWKRQAAAFFFGKINKLAGQGGRAKTAMARGRGAAGGAEPPAPGWAGQVAPAGGSGSAAEQMEGN